MHLEDDPSSNRCIRRTRMHPDLAPAHADHRLFAAVLRAGKDGASNGMRGRGGRVKEGRGRQQGTRDDADASSLVHLLSTSVLCVRNEPPGSSLLSSEGTDRHGQAVMLEVELRRAGAGSRARRTTLTRRLSCICSPPPSAVCSTSLWALRCGVLRARRGMGRRMGRSCGGRQERVAGDARQRGRVASRASATRLRRPCSRQASELVAVVFRGHGNNWEQDGVEVVGGGRVSTRCLVKNTAMGKYAS